MDHGTEAVICVRLKDRDRALEKLALASAGVRGERDEICRDGVPGGPDGLDENPKSLLVRVVAAAQASEGTIIKEYTEGCPACRWAADTEDAPQPRGHGLPAELGPRAELVEGEH